MNLLITSNAGYKSLKLAEPLPEQAHMATTFANFMYGHDLCTADIKADGAF